jgi:hypothetical protein
MSFYPNKRIRRNATSVMAGCFDRRPARDVLTSLLNGVPPYKEVERDEEAKKKRKEERKERRKLKKQQKEFMGNAGRYATTDGNFASTSSLPQSTFWRAQATTHKQPATQEQDTETAKITRPTINRPARSNRSFSVTPSPTHSTPRHASTPASTPGPSISSSTSRTSSKRPRTPNDDEAYDEALEPEPTAQSATPRSRKKRSAAKKGWKGWVEGSPPPSDKLINLDAVPLLQERRTRSGKNFDAISIGKDGWV